VKRKDVQRLARELVDAIDAMRQEMAMQDHTIQRQAADLAAERAEVARLTDRIATLTEQNSELATNYVGLLDSLAAERGEIQRLRAAGDALAEVALIAVIHCKDHDVEQCNRAYAAWQEARREQ